MLCTPSHSVKSTEEVNSFGILIYSVDLDSFYSAYLAVFRLFDVAVFGFSSFTADFDALRREYPRRLVANDACASSPRILAAEALLISILPIVVLFLSFVSGFAVGCSLVTSIIALSFTAFLNLLSLQLVLFSETAFLFASVGLYFSSGTGRYAVSLHGGPYWTVRYPMD